MVVGIGVLGQGRNELWPLRVHQETYMYSCTYTQHKTTPINIKKRLK